MPSCLGGYELLSLIDLEDMKHTNLTSAKACLFHFGLIMLCSLYLSGCAGTKEATQQEQTPETSEKSGIIEDFDPMSLEEIDFEVEPKLNIEAESSEAYRYLTANRDSSAGAEEESRKVPGYRVQISSVTMQEDADEIKLEAMLQFEEENVYLIFEAPYYKIRVGDFEIRRNAEALQKTAVDLGYGDAWIIRTIITIGDKSSDNLEP